MNDKIVYKERLTNFYKYPSVCGFQDKIDCLDDFTSNLMTAKKKERDTMIYIHIPFCRSMCMYCPFYKVNINSVDYDTKKRFVDSLILELEKYSKELFFKDVPIVNVHMGGGTPMVLEVEFFEKIISALHKNFDMSKCEVISIEGDPIVLQDVDNLKTLKSIGMTRTSIGIQTFNEALRKKLGIKSDISDIYKAVNALDKCGVTEWGCDMLYNCPDQNVNEVKYNVDRICELTPTVVDVYDLNIFPNTKLQKLLDTDYFRSKPSNKNEIEMFKAIMETFEENNFNQVRSVNFEPKGYKHSKKGILYAFSANLLAIGPSARTFLYDARMNYRNHCNIGSYMQSLDQNVYPIEAGNIVTENMIEEREIVFFPYYMKVEKNKLNCDRFGFTIDNLVSSGYINEANEYLELTDLGKLWAGNVQYSFFTDYEKERMAKSMFMCLQEKRNLFNQDNMNC